MEYFLVWRVYLSVWSWSPNEMQFPQCSFCRKSMVHVALFARPTYNLAMRGKLFRTSTHLIMSFYQLTTYDADTCC
jgi:hypothetical protein